MTASVLRVLSNLENHTLVSKMDNKKRCTKTSSQQYTLYIEDMESNEALRTNKLSPENPNVLDLTWEKLSSKLNASGGPQKSVSAWKKVFADWKCSVKKRARKLKLSQNGTGGGPPEKVLSDLEEKLIQVIGKVVVDGFLAVPEIGLIISDDGKNVENEQGCDEVLQVDNHNYIAITSIEQNQLGRKAGNNKRKCSNSPPRTPNPKKQKNNTSYQSKLSLGTAISKLSDIINNKSNIENEVNQSLKNINSNLEELVQIEDQKLKMLIFEFQQKHPDTTIVT